MATLYYESSYSELYHHGIKGQKWGIRRFQNKNGSLTGAGKKRYSDKSDKSESKENKERRKLTDKQEDCLAIKEVTSKWRKHLDLG